MAADEARRARGGGGAARLPVANRASTTRDRSGIFGPLANVGRHRDMVAVDVVAIQGGKQNFLRRQPRGRDYLR
jgi:hypothetical protein